MLQQRCGNVLTTPNNNVVTTSETDVATTLILDLATTLWQRQPQRRHNNAVPAENVKKFTFTLVLSKSANINWTPQHYKKVLASLLFKWNLATVLTMHLIILCPSIEL